jgi:hypothetical protein
MSRCGSPCQCTSHEARSWHPRHRIYSLFSISVCQDAPVTACRGPESIATHSETQCPMHSSMRQVVLSSVASLRRLISSYRKKKAPCGGSHRQRDNISSTQLSQTQVRLQHRVRSSIRAHVQPRATQQVQKQLAHCSVARLLCCRHQQTLRRRVCTCVENGRRCSNDGAPRHPHAIGRSRLARTSGAAVSDAAVSHHDAVCTASQRVQPAQAEPR